MSDTIQPVERPKFSFKKKPSKKVLFIVGGGVLIVALAVVFIWHPWNRGGQNSQGDNGVSGAANDGKIETDEEKYEKLVPAELSNKADAAATSGDVDGAVKMYQTAINNSSDSKQKSALYMQQAIALSNDKRYDEAIDAAKKSEAAEGQTLLNVTFLAITYERVEQYELAAKYYTKASEITPNENSSAGNKEYYLEKAKENEAKL